MKTTHTPQTYPTAWIDTLLYINHVGNPKDEIGNMTMNQAEELAHAIDRLRQQGMFPVRPTVAQVRELYACLQWSYVLQANGINFIYPQQRPQGNGMFSKVRRLALRKARALFFKPKNR